MVKVIMKHIAESEGISALKSAFLQRRCRNAGSNCKRGGKLPC